MKGEEAAELGDADSGLMWKPHNVEVLFICDVNDDDDYDDGDDVDDDDEDDDYEI